MKALIIHLSDLHLNEKNNSAEAKIPLVVAALQNEETAIDAIILIVSGDIVATGGSGEFQVANKLIGELCLQLKAKVRAPLIRLCIVPGNHDCVLPEEDSVRDAVITKIGMVKDADHIVAFD